MGIDHHVSCPHTHQQNGSAKLKHRHIVEVGLSLLAHASVPLKFWDEAFSTPTYLINILPSRILSFASLYERLFESSPDYNWLKVFRCVCWPHLRPYNSQKLELRSHMCAFFGYSSFHKGYKCLDIATGRVYISRDVVFYEDVFPFPQFHPNPGAQLRSKILLLPPPLHNSYEGELVAVSRADSANPATHVRGEEFVEENLLAALGLQISIVDAVAGLWMAVPHQTQENPSRIFHRTQFWIQHC
jgi:hypothetical protein